MAIFTWIATAIVTAIGSIGGITLATTVAGVVTLTTAGVIATSLIAGGLGYLTAKVTGVMKAPNIQAQKDPGVKIQLSPSTDRRVPVFYGKVHTGSIIVDAEIKNRNNTMVYCMVIGEKTDSGTFTVQSIKRMDAKLNFTGANVTSWTDTNATSSTDVANKMRCHVYAGNAQSSVNQIFPTTGKVAAQTLMSTITAATSYEDLVYAIFEIDYDAEEGLTALGTITYEITNSLTEPSNVLLDYCRNDRYGAGLANAQLDLPSFNDMYDYSNEQVAYTTAAGSPATHSRWQIDGVLSTYQAVKDNIDQICQSSSTFFTYDNKAGAFTVVPNRLATTAEKANAFIFTDDNIITAIDITSTELYSLYNQVEAEYPSVTQEDQTMVVVVTTPSGDRNTNEPDNSLGTRFNLVNDAPRAYNLSNIDLRQSRLSTTVSFSADYSALTVDVGDVVKVTNTLYGFSSKLFRVMQVSEVESETGYISAKLTLLEYADSVYDHNTIQSDGTIGLSGIPAWWNIWGNVDYANIANIVGNITVVDDPTSNIANVVDPTTGNIIANVDIANIDYGLEGIGYGITGGLNPSINVPITIPDIPGLDQIIANLNIVGSTESSNVANTMPATVIPILPPGGNTTFVPGEVINVTIPQPDLPLVDLGIVTGPLLGDIIANIDFNFSGIGGMVSTTATAPNITLTPAGSIDRGQLGAVQAGLQIEEDGFNAAMANSALSAVPLETDAALITANSLIDAGAIDEGIFSAVNNMVPYGSMLADGNAAVSYLPFRQINYEVVDIAADGTMTANTSWSNVGEIVEGSGMIASGLTQLSTIDDNFKYEVSRDRGSVVAVAGGLPARRANLDYLPANIVVGNWGNTNLGNGGAAVRRMDVSNSDKRISKSDQYLDIGGLF